MTQPEVGPPISIGPERENSCEVTDMSRIPLGVYAEAVMDLLIQQNHRRSEYRRYVSDHRHSPFRIEYVEVGNVSAPREPLVVLKRCTTLNGNNGIGPTPMT